MKLTQAFLAMKLHPMYVVPSRRKRSMPVFDLAVLHGNATKDKAERKKSAPALLWFSRKTK